MDLSIYFFDLFIDCFMEFANHLPVLLRIKPHYLLDHLIDTILIRMAQLNRRKAVLDEMRKNLPKMREDQKSYISRNAVPEYRYINYDLELVKKEYERISQIIMEMQMALDKYNQTVQFDVDI